MEDVYTLLHCAQESGDLNMYQGIYEEWQEYIEAEEGEVREVTWIPHLMEI